MINGLDLFSGIGGLAIALSDWVFPVAYCERERYAQSVLLSRMESAQLPAAPIWDDVRTLTAQLIPSKIDIIYGGFPCQDISVAGNGIGLEGKRSGLFFEILRLVDELTPAFVFMENVPAIRTRGGERVGKELAGRGYDCRWDVVSAEEVGAPHKRERWFFLAHSMCSGLQEPRDNEVSATESKQAVAYRHAGFSNTQESKVQSGRIPAELRLQEGIWSEDAANVGRIHDGIPPVVHRIRAMGNAVVPLQARAAFKRLMWGHH